MSAHQTGNRDAGEDVGSSPLACRRCKRERRKVKCNRALPDCLMCIKTGASCEYPISPEKPGPKLGSSHKKRRVHSRAGTSLQATAAARSSISGVSTAPGGIIHDNSNALSPRQRVDDPGTSSLVETPSVASGAAQDDGANPPGAPTFSQIMYPSHETQTRPQSPSVYGPSPDKPKGPSKEDIKTVCEGLKISNGAYRALMDSYFANMTSFSLFKPGSIEPKISSMRTPEEAEALVAAMFSFSARFRTNSGGSGQDQSPAGSYFFDIAVSRLDRSLRDYGDTTPPFYLLQTLILTTFYELTRSVRSQSWRSVGNCVRLAYDMNLHLIDADQKSHNGAASNTPDVTQWSLLEERRRAWWAVWEMDVFASTIRRLPTGIDWSQNLTFLPVHDHYWFSDLYHGSCCLPRDPGLRWKALSESGNNSPRAWFIVINSFMSNTQLVVYTPSSAPQSVDNDAESTARELSIMANCLYCTVSSLPPELIYQSEPLDFRTRSFPRDITPRQYHSDKYAIYLMTRLCRFMIHHQKICAAAPWMASSNDSSIDQPGHTATSDWANYMSAADEIAGIIRSSAVDHHRYVNPFLMNTVWFAAAAQCACRVIGPAAFDKRLAESNLDLLRLTLDRFISFWGSSDTLKAKLSKLETHLVHLVERSKESSIVPGNNATAPLTSPANTTSLNHAIAGQPGAQYSNTEDNSSFIQSTVSGFPGPGTTSFNPDTWGFSQPFLPGNQAWRGILNDPTDFFPFGLEELLMYDNV